MYVNSKQLAQIESTFIDKIENMPFPYRWGEG